MEVVWNGIIDSELLDEDYITLRSDLADASKSHDWSRVITIVTEHRDLVNATRLNGSSLYAPLHQAAYGGAPTEIILRLIDMGAWRTLQNACGERPLDVAEKRGHLHLLGVLAPQLKRRVPLGVLLKMQSHFHTVIGKRLVEFDIKGELRLPELEPLLEVGETRVWFQVPGMYGGFSYWLENDGVDPKLVAESWCRVAGGSGQRHEVTSAGSKLVDEGFV